MKISKEKFDEVYSYVPRTCVEVLIFTKDGFVLTKRNIEPCKGMWHIPGGTVFLGERLYNAATRIAFQELGVDVIVSNIIGIINYLKIYEGREQAVSAVFLCRLNEYKRFILDGQASEVGIFNIDKKIPENIILTHKNFLEFYFGNKEEFHYIED